MNATSIYNELQTSLKKGERAAVATVVKTVGAAPCGVGTKMLVRADGTTYGTFAGPNIDGRVAHEAAQALHEGRTYSTHFHLDADQGEAVGSCGATLEVFIEVLRPEPRLTRLDVLHGTLGRLRAGRCGERCQRDEGADAQD